MNGRSVLLLCVLLLPAAAVADDSSVYESLSGVHIGRVFLSPAERATLDARRERGSDAAGAAAGDDTGKSAPARAAQSAGYIIGRDGESKVWKNGDFVASGGAEAVKFPGAVDITRHETLAADD